MQPSKPDIVDTTSTIYETSRTCPCGCDLANTNSQYMQDATLQTRPRGFTVCSTRESTEDTLAPESEEESEYESGDSARDQGGLPLNLDSVSNCITEKPSYASKTRPEPEPLSSKHSEPRCSKLRNVKTPLLPHTGPP